MKKTMLWSLAGVILGALGFVTRAYWAESAPPPAARPVQAENAIPSPHPQPKQKVEPARALETDKGDQAQPSDAWIDHQIKKGESLAAIFSKYELGSRTLHSVLEDNRGLEKELSRLHPGKTLKLMLDDQGQLERLVYQQSKIKSIAVARTDNGFSAERILQEPLRQLQQVSGIIQSSLYLDGKKAGLDDKLIMNFTEIFGWDVDFARAIQPGDRFTVVFEKLSVDGETIGNGPIVAAEFVNRGQVYRALRFTLPNGESDYYTPEGQSLRKAFLRMPVESARISSRFNLHRKHPVLHRIRAHKGVDYAARIGTPVRATGDGKIIYRGNKGGYGRVVVIQHGQRFSTLYAHLNGFNKKFKSGSRVRQGDVIGYVGKSGLATGPHLHYEFRINGKHRDPLTVPLPGAKPIPFPLLTAFEKQTAPLLAELERASELTVAAANLEPKPDQ